MNREIVLRPWDQDFCINGVSGRMERFVNLFNTFCGRKLFIQFAIEEKDRYFDLLPIRQGVEIGPLSIFGPRPMILGWWCNEIKPFFVRDFGDLRV